MSAPIDLDTIRGTVLDRLERDARTVRLAVLGAATTELALFVVAFRLIDWHDRTQLLLFVLSVLGYTIVVLGLVALGAHVSRTVGCALAAIDPDVTS